MHVKFKVNISLYVFVLQKNLFRYTFYAFIIVREMFSVIEIQLVMKIICAGVVLKVIYREIIHYNTICFS